MKWGFLLSLFTLNLSFFPAARAMADVQLFEKAQTSFQLNNGGTLRFYFPEQNKELQQSYLGNLSYFRFELYEAYRRSWRLESY